MAVAISESVAVLLPVPSAASAPRAAAIAFAVPSPGGPRLNLSSKFKGLRVDGTAVTAKRRPGRRVGAVVCDASNTAVGAAKEVSKDTWDSLVLGSNLPVIVEFWAPWCGPCKLIHPVVDELAKEYAGKLKVYKLNTDESSDTATKYGVRSIPTVMLFKDAEKKDAVIGAVSKSTLVACIDRYL